MNTSRHLVIIGGGFAGVWAAMGAAREIHRNDAHGRVRITLVSPDDALTIAPRLYERDLAGVRVPLDPLLGPVDVIRRHAPVRHIDTDTRRLTLDGPDGGELSYDQLVLCAGGRLQTPPGDGQAHRVDSFTAATALQHAVGELGAGWHGGARRAIVVGAGFTGLELATELAGTLRAAARDRDEEPAEVLLLDRGPVVAGGYGPRGRAVITAALDELGITTRTGASVAAVDGDGVTLAGGERIDAAVVALATGPRAHPLAAQIDGAHDALGRIVVGAHLETEADGVWAAGDVAGAAVDASHRSLMSCQHAGPQGRRAGENAARALVGAVPRSYRQPLYLTCLDLGPAGALVTSGFERNEVLVTGADAKAIKRYINRTLIYPPPGAGRGELLKLGQDASPGRLGAAVTRGMLRSDRLRALATSRAEDRAARFAAADGELAPRPPRPATV